MAHIVDAKLTPGGGILWTQLCQAAISRHRLRGLMGGFVYARQRRPGFGDVRIALERVMKVGSGLFGPLERKRGERAPAVCLGIIGSQLAGAVERRRRLRKTSRLVQPRTPVQLCGLVV